MNKKTYIAPSFEVEKFKEASAILTVSGDNPDTEIGFGNNTNTQALNEF